MRNVFITNGDTAIADAIAHDILMGKYRETFQTVKVSVEKVSRSGDLWLRGAQLVEVGAEPDLEHLKREFQNIDTLVLVPSIGSHAMVHQTRIFLEAAKLAGVENCLLISIIGVDEVQLKTCKRFHEVEQELKKSNVKNQCVVRMGHLQQKLFWWGPMMQENRRFEMFLAGNQQKFAPLNLQDLCMFVSYILGESNFLRGEQLFQLTGTELITLQDLINRLNQQLGGDIIKYQQVEKNRVEEYLRREWCMPGLWVEEALDCFELIHRGKLNLVSHDQKKTIGHEPISVDKFLKEQSIHFKPLEGNRRR